MSKLEFIPSGHLSPYSKRYLLKLTTGGWPQEALAALRADLLRFESSLIHDTLEDSLWVLVDDWGDEMMPFFTQLARQVQQLYRTERSHALQKDAVLNHNKDANRMLDGTLEDDKAIAVAKQPQLTVVVQSDQQVTNAT